MKKQDIPRRFFGVPELARAYGVSDQTIYNMMNNGVVDCARYGRRRMLPADELPKLDAQFKVSAA